MICWTHSRAVARKTYDWGNVHEKIMTEAIRFMVKLSSLVFRMFMMTINNRNENKMTEANASVHLLLVTTLHFLIKFRASTYCFAFCVWSVVPLSFEGDIQLTVAVSEQSGNAEVLRSYLQKSAELRTLSVFIILKWNKKMELVRWLWFAGRKKTQTIINLKPKMISNFKIEKTMLRTWKRCIRIYFFLQSDLPYFCYDFKRTLFLYLLMLLDVVSLMYAWTKHEITSTQIQNGIIRELLYSQTSIRRPPRAATYYSTATPSFSSQ